MTSIAVALPHRVVGVLVATVSDLPAADLLRQPTTTMREMATLAAVLLEATMGLLRDATTIPTMPVLLHLRAAATQIPTLEVRTRTLDLVVLLAAAMVVVVVATAAAMVDTKTVAISRASSSKSMSKVSAPRSPGYMTRHRHLGHGIFACPLDTG